MVNLRKVLVYHNYRRLLKYFFWLIRIFENKQILKFSKKELKHLPTFIIGSPRTGSTVLYEILSNEMDVLYVDNLVNYSFRNLFFGFWLSDKFLKNKPHNCFNSNHGLTPGLRSPNEGDMFWYRFLPKDRHFVKEGQVSQKKINIIRNNLISIINKYNKPLLLKTMPAGLRLALIKVVFPSANFIFIRRNPVLVVQSILIGREKINKDRNIWWSIYPPNYEQIENLPYVEQIVRQVYYIEKQIYFDLKKYYDDTSVLFVDYDDIIEDSDKLLRRVQSFMNYDLLREGTISPQINNSTKRKLEKEIYDKIEEEVAKFDWDTYATP